MYPPFLFCPVSTRNYEFFFWPFTSKYHITSDCNIESIYQDLFLVFLTWKIQILQYCGGVYVRSVKTMLQLDESFRDIHECIFTDCDHCCSLFFPPFKKKKKKSEKYSASDWPINYQRLPQSTQKLPETLSIVNFNTLCTARVFLLLQYMQ